MSDVLDTVIGNIELGAFCDKLEAQVQAYKQFEGSVGAFVAQRLKAAGFKDYVPNSTYFVAHRSWHLKKVAKDKSAYYVEIIETSLFGKFTEISGRWS